MVINRNTCMTISSLGIFIILLFAISCEKNHDNESDSINYTPAAYELVIDVDGNEYQSIKIGSLFWMSENLRTTKYSDGSKIYHSQDISDWISSGLNKEGAYSIFPKTEGLITDIHRHNSKYGNLYNWYAVSDKRGLCPNGWHVPTNDDWIALTRSLELVGDVGTLLKDPIFWGLSEDSSNDINFNAIPNGFRNEEGLFQKDGIYSAFWTSIPSGTETAVGYRLDIDRTSIGRGVGKRSLGLSIRCVKPF